MIVNLLTSGLLEPGKLKSWAIDRQQKINRAVAAAMREEGPNLATASNEATHRALKVRDTKFPSFKAKVFDRDPNRLPVLQVGSKVPWLGAHVTGAEINGKLLIPFGQQRIGYKRWKEIIARLMATGNAYFRNVNGRVILFSENIKENAKQLRGAKRNLRRALGGGRVKAGADIPVAVLVNKVTLQKRINLEDIARQATPYLVKRIEGGLARAG